MLNLISDPWIPVLRRSGRDVIRPDQIAEADVLRPDWPRPDLNLACYELLIGLVYLAHAPKAGDDRVNPPDASALRLAMEPLAPAFNLLGDGPLDSCRIWSLWKAKRIRPTCCSSTVRAPARRRRMPTCWCVATATRRSRCRWRQWRCTQCRHSHLLEVRAIARPCAGGGPMVTMVKPADEGLWPLVWANVPTGEPLLRPEDLNVLPWMRPTETSKPVDKTSRITVPMSDSPAKPDPEVFFGQPRRLRLVTQDDAVTLVIQKPWGTNYEVAAWRHPLTPYYRMGVEFLPRHPKPGLFGYRNWRGVILQAETGAASRGIGAVSAQFRRGPLQSHRGRLGRWTI